MYKLCGDILAWLRLESGGAYSMMIKHEPSAKKGAVSVADLRKYAEAKTRFETLEDVRRFITGEKSGGRKTKR